MQTVRSEFVDNIRVLQARFGVAETLILIELLAVRPTSLSVRCPRFRTL